MIFRLTCKEASRLISQGMDRRLSITEKIGLRSRLSQAPMTPKNVETTLCPGCGGEFECRMLAGRESCWCEECPALPEPVAGYSCYCPRCLEVKARSARDPRSAQAP